MRILKVVFLLCYLFHQFAGYANEPNEEFRAVWLTTFAGLDWPKTYNKEEQKRTLLEIIDTLEREHFNAILFQARSRGDTFYQSSFEPWARELTGRVGQDPGWDPLAFLIEHAHERGIEVHAWFNMYKVWGAMPIPYDIDPPHILALNPHWAQIYGNEWWLDPGQPGVHTHLIKVALDLIERYPVDGIHFDHIRYPGRDFDDVHTYRRFGGGTDLHDWRRDNITNFVREFYEYATVIRPDIKIGSAPMGVFRRVSGFYGSTAYFDYYQDVERWLSEGIHDYVVPQIYWNAAHNPRFDVVLDDWRRRAHGRHVYAGIGAFRPEILRELNRQISLTRSLDIPGHVFFRYSHLADQHRFNVRYFTRAETPRMEWVESRDKVFNGQFTDYSVHDTSYTIQRLPVHLQYAMRDNDRNRMKTEKTRLPQRFIIYRSDDFPIDTNDPDHLLAVLPATTDSFNDEMNNPASSDYHYLVSTLNAKEEIEYTHEGNTAEIYLNRIAQLLDREIILPFIADPGDPDSFHLTLFMPSGMSASVNITNEQTGENLTIIEGYLDAGFHTIPINQNPDVPYIRCIIRVGDRTTERILKRTQ